jgi:hypothetical protein
MSGPSVTATIAVNDQASPALKELAVLAKKVAQETNGAMKGGSGDAYAASLNRANSAARQHLGTLTQMRDMHREIAALAGGIVAGRVAQDVKAKVVEGGKYEKEVRLQAASSTDPSRPGGKYDDADLKLLAQQRVDAAKRLGIMPEETMKAQSAFVNRAFTANVTKAATDKALELSKALNVPAEEAAKIVEGGVFGQGIHLHSPEQAALEMAKANDRATVMFHKARMTPEDIIENQKFSLGMATAAGVSPDTNSAIAMTLKRANVSGAESGVFERQFYARLMAPTKQGYDALASAGINYDDYAKHGDVSPEAIDASLQRRFGKGLNEDGRAALRERLDDPEGKALSSREEFAKAVHDAVDASGQKMSKTDEKHVNDAAMRQFDLAKTGLRGDALAKAIIAKMTPQQLQGYLGDKQAGRGTQLLNNQEDFNTYLHDLENAQNVAADIAKERMAGLGFALDRLTSSVDSAEKDMVLLASGPLEGLTNAASKIVNVFDGLPDGVKAGAATAGVMGLGAAALASVAGVVSLGASAATAAASLNLLATRGLPIPGGSSIPGTVAKVEGAAPTVAAASTVGAKIGSALGVVSKAIGWAAVAELVVSSIYGITSDEATGFDRKNSPEHSRADAIKQAIKRDADDRMQREIERDDQQAKDAAARGDANVDRAMPRKGSMQAYRQALHDQEGGSVWEDGSAPIAQSPAVSNVVTTVTGTVEGTGTLSVKFEPSQWLVAKIGTMESAIIALKGTLGSDKTGTGLGGSQGAQPVATGAGGH